MLYRVFFRGYFSGVVVFSDAVRYPQSDLSNKWGQNMLVILITHCKITFIRITRKQYHTLLFKWFITQLDQFLLEIPMRLRLRWRPSCRSPPYSVTAHSTHANVSAAAAAAAANFTCHRDGAFGFVRISSA